MLYMMPTDLLNDAFQSWFAAARDQATLQMIATQSVQNRVQSELKKNLESCALYVEDQVDVSYEPMALSSTPAKRARKSHAQ
ncbi:MAG: hypothetical protein HYX43_21160 [Burkholderiales bacterium]|nr:hypothetical protein [Burkholderiales bacterium]